MQISLIAGIITNVCLDFFGMLGTQSQTHPASSVAEMTSGKMSQEEPLNKRS